MQSPKSDAFPVDAKATNCILLTPVGVDPPAEKWCVLLLKSAAPCKPVCKSPKSDALPVVDIVKKSITLETLGVNPPEVNPLLPWSGQKPPK